MKRFTETTKWDDPWFRKLPMESKLFWQWLLDHCDHAGVIDPDVELAEFQIGYRKGKANLLESLGGRIMKLPNGKIWIVKFMEFQYSKLSENCPAHRPVYQSVARNGLDELPKGYPKGIPTLKDKDKSTDKEEDEESGPPKADDLAIQSLAIWKASPPPSRTRSSQKKLLAAWKAVKDRPTVAYMLATLDAWKQCEDWQKDGGQFIAGIHLWVKDEKFRDQPEPYTPPRTFERKLSNPKGH